MLPRPPTQAEDPLLHMMLALVWSLFALMLAGISAILFVAGATTIAILNSVLVIVMAWLAIDSTRKIQ
jgi:hypothetical protein